MTTVPGSTNGARDSRLAQWIITLFALYARAEGNWLSVASVVEMMAGLGVDGQAVRSSIYRLKRRGMLVSGQHAGAASYSLAHDALEVLAEGDVRIFERARAETGDGWVVAVFSVPESEREKRHALRSTLTRLGFGTVTPGVWVAPEKLAPEARQALERGGLAPYVDILTGQHFAFGELRAKVREWWDLDELAELYSEFLKRYSPIRHRTADGETTPLDAFGIYVPMLTHWRRLPYRDPGLPLNLLPPRWIGLTAGDLFTELNDELGPLAQKHALAVIHGKSAKKA